MESIVLIVHVVVAVAIIALILVQQGKGAEAGASFGAGASQTVFGSQGNSNFFARLTGILGFVFFATSLTLAVMARQNSEDHAVPGVPEPIDTIQMPIDEPIAAPSDIPVANGESFGVESRSDLPESN